MNAEAVIAEIHPSSMDPNFASHLIQFSATDDPRSGELTAEVDIRRTEQEIRDDIRQAVASFINVQRGSTVISAADVRLP